MNENKLLQKKYFFRVLLFAFITAALSIVPHMISNGGIFSLRDDFDYQQTVFAMFCNDALKSGETGWSWYTDLGGSFIGSYSFYNLGSPFFLLSAVFPSSWYPYLIGIFLILKYCVAACLAYLYIGRFVKNQNYAVIGAMLYAFCGFQTMNLMFPFHDVTAIFPLMLIGIEELAEKRRFGVLALSVAISAVLNYYFLFGQIIFLAIYFIFRFLISDFKKHIRTLGLCLLEGIIGIGISAFFFLPSAIAVMDNPRIGSFVSQIVYDWQTYLMIMQAYFIPSDVMGSQAYFINRTCDSCAVYLPLFAMTLVFGYILKNKKNPFSWLMVCLAGISLIPVLNASFSMFNSRYYARWYYMMSLVFALASAMMLDDFYGFKSEKEKDAAKSVKYGFILNSAGSILTLLAMAGVIVISVAAELHIEDKVDLKTMALYAVLTLLGLAVSFICLSVNDTKKRIAFILAGVMMSSLITTSLAVCRYKKGESSGYWYNDSIESVSKAIDSEIFYDSTVSIAENISLPDSQDYRVKTAWYDKDKNYIWHSYDNLSLLLKVPSVDSFNSTVSGGIFEFYDAIGIGRSVTTLDNTYAGLLELLSCRYYFTSLEEPSKEIISSYTDSAGDTVYVYEYDNFIPIGFTYDWYISENDFAKYDTETKCLILLNAVVLSDEEIAETKDVISEIPEEVISGFSESNVSSYVEERKKESSVSFERDSYSFRSEIVCEDDSFAYFSVPCDRGWSAKVNGKDVEIINSCGMMIVPVESGENIIEFEYEIPGFKIGSVISVISFTALVILWVVSKKEILHNAD